MFSRLINFKIIFTATQIKLIGRIKKFILAGKEGVVFNKRRTILIRTMLIFLRVRIISNLFKGFRIFFQIKERINNFFIPSNRVINFAFRIRVINSRGILVLIKTMDKFNNSSS